MSSLALRPSLEMSLSQQKLPAPPCEGANPEEEAPHPTSSPPKTVSCTCRHIDPGA